MSLSISTTSRILVAGRDEHRCLRCGMRGNNWHHRRTRATRDEHTHLPCNGITLCGSGSTGCHGWVHSHPFESRGKGWIVSKYVSDPGEVPVFCVRRGWILLDHNTGGFTASSD